MNNRFARVIIVGLVLLLIPSACIQVVYDNPEQDKTEPTAIEDIESPETSEEANPYADKPYVQLAGIRIYYEPDLENYVDEAGEVVAPNNGEMAYSVAHPGYSDFNFSPMQAHIYVTPVAAYEEAADFAPGLIADLHRVLDGSETLVGNCMPELPLGTFYQVCDHQEFVSNAKLIPFGNGNGVRFITVHAIQDLAPVDNQHLVYVFQGFTDDGNYYVKAVVEMMHSMLEGTGEIPAGVYQSFDSQVVDSYFNNFAAIFKGAEKSFTPDLEWIDSVLAGLYIMPVPVG